MKVLEVLISIMMLVGNVRTSSTLFDRLFEISFFVIIMPGTAIIHSVHFITRSLIVPSIYQLLKYSNLT